MTITESQTNWSKEDWKKNLFCSDITMMLMDAVKETKDSKNNTREE